MTETRTIARSQTQTRIEIRGPLGAVNAAVTAYLRRWSPFGYGTREVSRRPLAGGMVAVIISRFNSCD